MTEPSAGVMVAQRTSADAPVRVEHWVELWLRERHPVTEAREKADRSRVQRHLLPRLGRRSVVRLTPEAVESWVTELQGAGVGNATVHATLLCLRQALELARDADVIQVNPARGISVEGVSAIREISPNEVLTESEVGQLLGVVDPAYRALVHIAVSIGTKWEEALGLQVGDLFLQRSPANVAVGRYRVVETAGTVEVIAAEASREIRLIEIDDDLAADLRRHLAETESWRANAERAGHVFLTKRAHTLPLRPNFIMYTWRPALEAAGIDRRMPFHALRHTAATRMIARGVPVEDLCKTLGHSNVGTTRRLYGHFLRERDAVGRRVKRAH